MSEPQLTALFIAAPCLLIAMCYAFCFFLLDMMED